MRKVPIFVNLDEVLIFSCLDLRQTLSRPRTSRCCKLWNFTLQPYFVLLHVLASGVELRRPVPQGGGGSYQALKPGPPPAGIARMRAALPRKVPVKVEPKTFFANERTYLAWLHMSVSVPPAEVAAAHWWLTCNLLPPPCLDLAGDDECGDRDSGRQAGAEREPREDVRAESHARVYRLHHVRAAHVFAPHGNARAPGPRPL